MMNQNNNNDFLDFVYDFYKSMKAYEIKIAYEGKITHQITKAFAALAEAQMEENEEVLKIRRIVYHVIVECLQNISKHADDYEPESCLVSGRGIFLVRLNPDAYYITTGNIIRNEKIPELGNMLNQVNKLNTLDLKILYKKQMKEGRISDKGGAGLGFIDIRRKTGTKLEYQFLPISESLSFFLITTAILRKN